MHRKLLTPLKLTVVITTSRELKRKKMKILNVCLRSLIQAVFVFGSNKKNGVGRFDKLENPFILDVVYV